MPGGPGDVPGPLAGRELRCLMMSANVVYGKLRGGGQVVWRWTTDNSWSPIPDQWFASPEEALERFWEAAR